MATFQYGLNWRAPSSYRLTPRPNTSKRISPFTGDIHRLARQGSRWEYELSWENVDDVDRERVMTWLVSLNGGEHLAEIRPFEETNKGVYDGTREFGGGSVGATSMQISGGINTSGWAKRGDLFTIGPDGGGNPAFGDPQTLYIVTGDISTDAGGLGTLNFWPPLSEAVASLSQLADMRYATWILLETDGFDVRDVLQSGELVTSTSARFLSTGR